MWTHHRHEFVRGRLYRISCVNDKHYYARYLIYMHVVRSVRAYYGRFFVVCTPCRCRQTGRSVVHIRFTRNHPARHIQDTVALLVLVVQVTMNNIRGYLPSKITQFLMCLHTGACGVVPTDLHAQLQLHALEPPCSH